MVHSADGGIDFCDNVPGILPRYSLAPFLLIVCLDYVLQTSIDLMKKKNVTGENFA